MELVPEVGRACAVDLRRLLRQPRARPGLRVVAGPGLPDDRAGQRCPPRRRRTAPAPRLPPRLPLRRRGGALPAPDAPGVSAAHPAGRRRPLRHGGRVRPHPPAALLAVLRPRVPRLPGPGLRGLLHASTSSSCRCNAGDLLFFNPALFHAAGDNRTADVVRTANLLQVSSAFGKPMETIDTTGIILRCFGDLQALHRARRRGGARGGAHDGRRRLPVPGQPGPTPPTGGLAPPSQRDVLRQALDEGWSLEQLSSGLAAQQAAAAHRWTADRTGPIDPCDALCAPRPGGRSGRAGRRRLRASPDPPTPCACPARATGMPVESAPAVVWPPPVINGRDAVVAAATAAVAAATSAGQDQITVVALDPSSRPVFVPATTADAVNVATVTADTMPVVAVEADVESRPSQPPSTTAAPTGTGASGFDRSARRRPVGAHRLPVRPTVALRARRRRASRGGGHRGRRHPPRLRRPGHPRRRLQRRRPPARRG